MYKKMVKSVLLILLLFYGICGYSAGKVPDIINIPYGYEVKLRSQGFISLHPVGKTVPMRDMDSNTAVQYTARLLGIFPVKEVSVVTGEESYVAVSGRPFGIKMFCDGAMVVGFSDILTASGYKNPARLAGLKAGDIIISMDNLSTKSNEDVEKIISKNKDKSITITYLRDNRQYTATITAVKDANTDSYRTGMWVRDSGAGIGTMTFYDLERGYFSGLGHGIKDVDTHQELRLLSGDIVPVKITGIVKSKNGTAGQLKGNFTTTIASGKILHNGSTGVYGKAYSVEKENVMPVATPSQIHTGKAYILTTLNGTQPQKYEIEIEKVNLTTSDPNKNMVIRITDSQLLALSGGIVRGFSGSPIIQDGRLAGAVTHVFVNQVDRGYGIFASNMLATIDEIAENDSNITA